MKKILFIVLTSCLLLIGKDAMATPPSEKMSAYLMVYHKDADHSLHMAISHDGYHWKALNGDRPVIAGDTIAEQRGIRDPHIFRGPDGAFYLSMTDLHIFAQRDGYRTTKWERDDKQFGWGNNRGLVLMKSHDLLHWTRANINFTQLANIPGQSSPNSSLPLADIGCVWAPETTYDDETGQLMIHFTMRHGKQNNALYYSYINNDYNKLLTMPKLLLEAPDRKYSVIDGDIVKHGGKYHLFYVSHESGACICRVTADHITGPYTVNPQRVSTERRGHEAPNVWQRISDGAYVLMYDIYRNNPHTFGFDESTDLEHFTHLGQFSDDCMKMEGCVSPKHGAVVQITEEEARRLECKWNK